MRPLAVALLVAALVGAVAAPTLVPATAAVADAAPAAPAAGQPDAASPPGTATAPGEGDPRGAADDPAALPRAPVERTTIFGISPVGAVVMAASLLVVIVLTIVAMTRSQDAHLDFDRRD